MFCVYVYLTRPFGFPASLGRLCVILHFSDASADCPHRYAPMCALLACLRGS